MFHKVVNATVRMALKTYKVEKQNSQNFCKFHRKTFAIKIL